MLENLTSLVAKSFEEKDYRPVAVGIVEDCLGRILFVQSAKNLDDWSFPQGGIEEGENPKSALLREIGEETGISFNQLSEPEFKGSEVLDSESSRLDKRGFTRGKRYFFFSVFYSGPTELKIDTGELNDYRWIVLSEVLSVLSTTRNDKKLLMLKFLAD